MLLDFFKKKIEFYSVSPFQGKSDGETTDMSVLTEVQDLKAVISYVRSLPYAGETLVLMG